MLKKLKAQRRRSKVKKLIRDHAKTIVVGAAMAVATDVAATLAHDKLEKKFGRKFRT
jgi:hypothetical protein